MNDPAGKAVLLAPTKCPFSGGKTMLKKKIGAIAIKSFALLVVLGTAYQAMAQGARLLTEGLLVGIWPGESTFLLSFQGLQRPRF
jgi:hypothetical protein